MIFVQIYCTDSLQMQWWQLTIPDWLFNFVFFFRIRGNGVMWHSVNTSMQFICTCSIVLWMIISKCFCLIEEIFDEVVLQKGKNRNPIKRDLNVNISKVY